MDGNSYGQFSEIVVDKLIQQQLVSEAAKHLWPKGIIFQDCLGKVHNLSHVILDLNKKTYSQLGSRLVEQLQRKIIPKKFSIKTIQRSSKLTRKSCEPRFSVADSVYQFGGRQSAQLDPSVFQQLLKENKKNIVYRQHRSAFSIKKKVVPLKKSLPKESENDINSEMYLRELLDKKQSIQRKEAQKAQNLIILSKKEGRVERKKSTATKKHSPFFTTDFNGVSIPFPKGDVKKIHRCIQMQVNKIEDEEVKKRQPKKTTQNSEIEIKWNQFMNYKEEEAIFGKGISDKVRLAKGVCYTFHGRENSPSPLKQKQKAKESPEFFTKQDISKAKFSDFVKMKQNAKQTLFSSYDQYKNHLSEVSKKKSKKKLTIKVNSVRSPEKKGTIRKFKEEVLKPPIQVNNQTALDFLLDNNEKPKLKKTMQVEPQFQ